MSTKATPTTLCARWYLEPLLLRANTHQVLINMLNHINLTPNVVDFFKILCYFSYLGGLLFKMSDSNMQYVTSSTFLLLTYAKYLTFSKQVVTCSGVIVTPQKLRAVAKKQVPIQYWYSIQLELTSDLLYNKFASSEIPQSLSWSVENLDLSNLFRTNLKAH